MFSSIYIFIVRLGKIWYMCYICTPWDYSHRIMLFFTLSVGIIEIEFDVVRWTIVEFTEDTSGSIHAFRSEKFITCFICRTFEVDNTLDSDLNYQFRTLIARWHSTIERGSLHITSHRIKNSICFSMDDIGML